MIRGMDTLSRSFDVLEQKQRNLATNAANVTTPGYKSQRLVASTLPETGVHNYQGGNNLNQRQELGEIVFGNQLDAAYRNFSSGALQGTEMQTDLSLQGEGAFFTVQDDEGNTYLTRNGNFTVNENNELVTQNGYNVLGIQVGGGTENILVDPLNFSIDQYGFVHNGQNNAQQFLYITNVEDTDTLVSFGDTLFESAEGTPMGTGFSIQQGFIEQSNVDMADIMTDMLQISREFEANQRVLSSINETLQRATTEIGRV